MDKRKVEKPNIEAPAVDAEKQIAPDAASVDLAVADTAQKSTAKKTTAKPKTATAKFATAKSAATKSTAAKSATAKTATTKSTAAKPAAKKTAATKTAAAKSTTAKTATAKSAAAKTATAKTTAKKSAASKSAKKTAENKVTEEVEKLETENAAVQNETAAVADNGVDEKSSVEAQTAPETEVKEAEVGAQDGQAESVVSDGENANDEQTAVTPVSSESEVAADAGVVASAEKSSDSAHTETNEQPLLSINGLKKYFPIKTDFFGRPTRYLRAVDDISFDLAKGKTIGIVGESGCGKTTLGRTIIKLYESDGGSIVFDGNDITHLKKRQMQKYRTDIQLIFQDPYSSLPPRMTVGSIIAEPVKVHKIVPKDQVHSYVMDIMKKCGLKPQHYDRYPHEFSGGQRQRICIARALAVKPKLVICDEPVSALDVSIQAQIINLLKELQNKEDLTYVFISHDLSVVKYITDNILVMYLGNAMEMSETDELFDNPLHPYTQALFSAVPVPNPDAKMNRIVLEGDIPSPANPPAGCKFHTRCSKCMKVCKFKEPKYMEVKEGHFVACHLYNDEIMNNLEEYDAEYDRIEREKQLALEAELAKKKHGKHTDPADEQTLTKPQETEQEEVHDVPQEAEKEEAHDVPQEAEKEEVHDIPQEAEQEVAHDIPQEAEQEAAHDVPQEAEKETKPDDGDGKDDGHGGKGGSSVGRKKTDGAYVGVKSKGKGKASKAEFVDDGRTVYSMKGLSHGYGKEALGLTRKEKRAALRAAFAHYAPAFLGALCCFSVAAILAYLWLL